MAITRELPRPTGEGRFGSLVRPCAMIRSGVPPRTRYGTAPRDDPRTITVGPGFVKTTHLNSPPPSPTQSFEPSDDETQHPRDADGDNVSAATTYNVRAHSGGKGVSDDEHEHEQVRRAVNSCTRRACRDSLAAQHSLQGSITSHDPDRSHQNQNRNSFENQ